MQAKWNEHTTGSQLVEEYRARIRDKVLLVTGASPPGIGHLFVLALARASPRLVILAGHNVATLETTAGKIREINADVKVKHLGVDLGSFESIRLASNQINSWADVPYIDVVVNNAGVMAAPWGKTADGFERQFGVNHLGHFLLTNLIMGKILASQSPRVVSVSSDGHRLNPIRWTDYNFGDGAHYDKWRAYGQSKTANNLFAISLAAKFGARGLDRFVDWGSDFDTLKAADIVMGTRLIGGEFQHKSADEIIATHVYAAFADDIGDFNGAYLNDCRVADQTKEEVWPWAKDPIDAERLWSLSEKLVGEEFSWN
ncbi:short-chain dehydrogenase/reductase family [Colletotrichum kahawae]|uniref:Short-chain dehydrogenase/reductase family n=1 Tax=Colletotrichum kahawae TaxID=34407 RepID=A0AAD9YLI1_COLKA|nr:short-chain dehydrogenase/reductase family [Colletotrichum kahawae]